MTRQSQRYLQLPSSWEGSSWCFVMMGPLYSCVVIEMWKVFALVESLWRDQRERETSLALNESHGLPCAGDWWWRWVKLHIYRGKAAGFTAFFLSFPPILPHLIEGHISGATAHPLHIFGSTVAPKTVRVIRSRFLAKKNVCLLFGLRLVPTMPYLFSSLGSRQGGRLNTLLSFTSPKHHFSPKKNNRK